MAEVCPQCNRKWTEGRSHCVFCGHGIQTGGKLDRESRFVDLPCSRCGRTRHMSERGLLHLVEQGRALCDYCKGPLVLPPHLAERANAAEAKNPLPYDVVCPGCLRTRKTLPNPEEILPCSWCGMKFRAPPDKTGPVRLGPASPNIPTAETLAQALAALPPTQLGRFASQVFTARAQLQELTVEELNWVVPAISRVEAWSSPEDEAMLPVPPTFAEELIAVLLDTRSYAMDRRISDNPVFVWLALTNDGGRPEDAAAMALANLAGIGLLAMTGTGFVVAGKSETAALRIRIGLEEHPVGTRLELRSQVDDEPSQPLSPEARVRLWGSNAQNKRRLLAYLGIVAIYGTWGQGHPSLRARREAIAARLERLGFAAPVASQAATTLKQGLARG